MSCGFGSDSFVIVALLIRICDSFVIDVLLFRIDSVVIDVLLILS